MSEPQAGPQAQIVDDSVLVDLCAELYKAAAGDTWDDLLWPEADDGICVGVKRLGKDLIIAFRGSVTAQDWFRDGISEIPHHMPGWHDLGFVPLGFSDGMPEAYGRLAGIAMASKGQIWVTGHSLGAARAQILAGMLTVRGVKIAGLVGFGAPRVGIINFRLAVADVPWRLYKNIDDPVTEIPTSPPWQDVREPLRLAVGASPGDSWGLLKHHHIELYQQGVRALVGR